MKKIPIPPDNSMAEQGKQIYVLTAGEYSDYHIVGVFTTYELAQKYAEFSGADSQIESYSLDIKPPAWRRPGENIYDIFLQIIYQRTRDNANFVAPGAEMPVAWLTGYPRTCPGEFLDENHPSFVPGSYLNLVSYFGERANDSVARVRVQARNLVEAKRQAIDFFLACPELQRHYSQIKKIQLPQQNG
jgi:hypothetical protein